ncbi:outer membrane lipoprotein chaperone LolA [Paucibacter sp. APW11]|uniref:Outer-membrane lipoprotein carrier protein n=1 Tax=Roseateles aquae TaxID=3077235 RepID=A0ABU3P8L1_9BURK|nr:outer membrane lipoprotein chaperone LolA [Paucibacter sp. APW11]MDT8998911.1 outer membrane lipoprotein chaperone LolA [Paucibacter sp. APW11]
MLRIAALLCAFATTAVQADGVQALNDFLREVKSGRANFVQTVSTADGQRKKSITGSFEFQRPNQFRFVYAKPAEQLIVGDGEKVWIYDPGLMQASSRKLAQALGSTPAALLAGGTMARDFVLKAQPAEGGLDWVLATPRQAEGNVQNLRVGFKGKDLAAIEILDSFGQRSLLQFSAAQFNVPLPAEHFRFELPKGADLLEQ